MTTDEDQQTLISQEELIAQLQALVEIHLKQIAAWTKLPDGRTDWELEVVLDDLAVAAKALRQHRNDQELPF